MRFLLPHVLRILLLSLCLLCLVPFMAFATAFAASGGDPILITSQEDTIYFPKYIDFRLTATDSSSTITQATLDISGSDSGAVASVSAPVNFTPARTITLDYHESLSGNNFITPGAIVKYNWVLQDSAGNTHTEQTQQFTMVDSRFSWQHVVQGQVTVEWYSRPASFGQTLLTDATGDITRIGNGLGGSLQHPITLWVYASPGDFQGALPPGSFEWVGGIAFPSLNTAYISVSNASDDTLIRDMPHELTHLVFHQLTAQGIEAPTWFDEGLAVYNQQYHEPNMTARFDQALASHALLRLSDISYSFPANADKAYLAYAQSWNLLSYMYTTFGEPKMAHLIQLMNNADNDFSTDLTKAIGEDALHLENQWRLSLHQPPVLLSTNQPSLTGQPSQTLTVPANKLPSLTDNMQPVFISVGVLLILVSFLGIVYILVSQQQRRQQMLAVQDAQRILSMSLGQQTPASYRPSPSSQPSPSYPSYPRYMPPPPSSGNGYPYLPGPPASSNGQREDEYPSFGQHQEYPPGPQQQAPQE